MSYLEKYLKTRRENWPYEGRYQLEQFKKNGYIAKIDSEVAGFIWADDIAPKEARMKLHLKSEYAEYGIGTELLETMVSQLKNSGYNKIYYTISTEHYAYQIYKHLEFEIAGRDEDTIDFLWERK